MHRPPGFRYHNFPDHVFFYRVPFLASNKPHDLGIIGLLKLLPPLDFNRITLGNIKTYLLSYVDDIILTTSNTSFLQHIISRLSYEFSMTNLGALMYLLGFSVVRSGLFLSQPKYATYILRRANMLNCNPCRTPAKLVCEIDVLGPPVVDLTLYRSLAGVLQFLSFTRLDISFTVQHICLFMYDTRDQHLNALKRILKDVRCTIDLGLQIHASKTTSDTTYSDVDWGAYLPTRQSTSGYCVFMGDNLI